MLLLSHTQSSSTFKRTSGSTFNWWLAETHRQHSFVYPQGCSGLIKELRMYVQTPKTIDEEARHLVRLCDAKC